MLFGEPLWLLMTEHTPHLSPLKPGPLHPDSGAPSVTWCCGIPSGQWASLTVVIYQPEAIMDPIVCLFSPGLLQGQDTEDAWCSRGSSSHRPPPDSLPTQTSSLPPSLPSIHHPLLHFSTTYPSSAPVGGGSLKPSPAPHPVPSQRAHEPLTRSFSTKSMKAV